MANAGAEHRVNGYGYVEWQNQGLHYSLVGDLPANQLHRIADRLIRDEVVITPPYSEVVFYQINTGKNQI